MNTLFSSSDPTLLYAFVLGVAIAAMAVLMLIVVLVLRQSVMHRERVHREAVAFWQTVLVPNPDPEPREIPTLHRQDVSGFLQVWNEVHEPMKGETTDFLARVAREVKLQEHLHRRLKSRGFHKRLVALIALGHIRNHAAFEDIQAFIDDKNPIVSLCAARALMQVDPENAVSRFVPHIVSRADWSQGHVATILSEMQSESVTRELSVATLQANVEIAPRLVRFLAGVNPQAAGPILRQLLTTSQDERLISTCLQVMTDPKDLDLVRPLLAHPRWHVRMQAAVTLGRLGVPGDEQRLIPILADSQWWVRYRAAQALTHLRHVSDDDVRRIQAQQTDKYARDIIRHVLAEQEMGIVPKAVA